MTPVHIEGFEVFLVWSLEFEVWSLEFGVLKKQKLYIAPLLFKEGWPKAGVVHSIPFL
jgi:hypothetical protein